MSLILVLVLSLQAAAVATPAAPAPPPAMTGADGRLIALDFDLARYRTAGAGRCAGTAAGDVLVCGPRHGRGDYPIDYWDRIFGPERPIRAEMGLGGGAMGDVHVEQVEYSNGTVANRVMVGIRMPF